MGWLPAAVAAACAALNSRCRPPARASAADSLPSRPSTIAAFALSLYSCEPCVLLAEAAACAASNIRCRPCARASAAARRADRRSMSACAACSAARAAAASAVASSPAAPTAASEAGRQGALAGAVDQHYLGPLGRQQLSYCVSQKYREGASHCTQANMHKALACFKRASETQNQA